MWVCLSNEWENLKNNKIQWIIVSYYPTSPLFDGPLEGTPHFQPNPYVHKLATDMFLQLYKARIFCSGASGCAPQGPHTKISSFLKWISPDIARESVDLCPKILQVPFGSFLGSFGMV